MKIIRKNIMKITFFVIFFFVISIIVIKNNLKKNEVYANLINDNELSLGGNVVLEEKESKEQENAQYFVDIKGQILNPGVYKVNENARVIDVINMAGGLNDNSDTSKINLAKKIKDEMVIIIYSKEEIKKSEIKEINIDYTFNDALIEDKNIVINDTENSDNNIMSKQDNELININICTKDELLTLSGIGESKADAIISYREKNGDFKTIEDILNVSGIGNSIYEKIKNYITT